MKKAFTLIEMLIVIAIVSVLAGVMIVTFTGSTESARAAQCMSNMRNLAVAVSSASLNKEAMQSENWYVRASDAVWKDMVGGYRKRAKEIYRYRRGWISNYPGPAGWNQSMSSSGRVVSAYDSDPQAVTYALTNGAIWSIMGKRDGYICPSHASARGGQTPAWSYVMNSRFDDDILYGSFGGASKTVMFAELPFGGGDGETEADAVLAYPNDDAQGSPESIAFNHRDGKKKCAHVVFADGSAKKIIACGADAGYKKGWIDRGSNSEYHDLTEWLCTGKDYSFDGNHYRKID